MAMTRRKTAVLISAARTILTGAFLLHVLAVRPPAARADEPGLATKDLLTPESFAELHRLIGPARGDYRWEEIPWLTSLWHARTKAAAEDKPIFVFGTGGAGFNDPLGNC